MSIVVVSSLPQLSQLPLAAASADTTTATASRGGDSENTAGAFAMLLLGLPGTAPGPGSTDAGTGKDLPADLPQADAEGNQQLLATLALTFAPAVASPDGGQPPRLVDQPTDTTPAIAESGNGRPIAPLLPTGSATATGPSATRAGNDQAAKVAAVPPDILPEHDASARPRQPDFLPADPSASFTVLLASQQAKINLESGGLASTGPSATGESRLQEPVFPLSPPEQAPPVNGHHSAAGMNQPLDAILAHPVHHPAWANELGQKLIWFAGNDRQSAQLSLNPPQLGSIEVRLQLDNTGATAHFAAASAEARNALESAVPRLREMLATAGIELGQVTVGSESFQQSSHREQPAAQQVRSGNDRAILGEGSTGALPGAIMLARQGRSLVDTFA